MPVPGRGCRLTPVRGQCAVLDQQALGIEVLERVVKERAVKPAFTQPGPEANKGRLVGCGVGEGEPDKPPERQPVLQAVFELWIAQPNHLASRRHLSMVSAGQAGRPPCSPHRYSGNATMGLTSVLQANALSRWSSNAPVRGPPRPAPPSTSRSAPVPRSPVPP